MPELVKTLSFDKACREALIAGVSKVAQAVASTMGPAGKTVILESPEHTKGLTVTKDGYNVARSISLQDPVENIAATIIKEAAYNTANTAGDGTTTAIVIAEALIKVGNQLITEGMNQTQVLRYITEISENIREYILKTAIPCDDKILLDVATISANNDPEIGGIIADTYKEVGVNGIVNVSKSLNSETYAEISSGIKIERGYTSPLFINNRVKDQCIMEKVHILVCDTEINSWHQLEPIMKEVYPKDQNLLIIAPVEQNVLAALVANATTNDPSRKKLKVCVVAPPSFGFKTHDLMEDIALTVGATFFSQNSDANLNHVSFQDLGFAQKVVVSRHKTEIIGRNGNEEEIEERVEQLKKLKEHTKSKEEIQFASERIAHLTGGVGVIYVGGNTDMEQKELYDRMEDAVFAVRSALEEGVVPGAGKALYEVATEVGNSDIGIMQISNPEYNIAKQIIFEAISKPLKQIMTNADLKYENYYGKDTMSGNGYNLKTGKNGNLVEMGIIDPAKVVRTALQNAVSVATTILSTNASVTITRA